MATNEAGNTQEIKTKDISLIVSNFQNMPAESNYYSEFLKEIIGKTQINKWPKSNDKNYLIYILKEGLKPKSVDRLQAALQLTKKDTFKFLHIANSTFKRRIDQGKLNADESDRVYRFAHLFSMAIDMMQGNRDAAVKWFNSPKAILNDESPLEHATSELGAREVEQLIGRIRHGVYS